MSTTDQLLKNADRYAATFDKGALPSSLPPARWRSSRAWTLGSTRTGSSVSKKETHM